MTADPQVTTTAETVAGRPGPAVAPYVRRYVGYRYAGLAPGTHVGLPSPFLTVVVSLGAPTRVSDRPGDPPAAYAALASGLQAGPAHVHHDGSQHGLQLDLTPAGARALVGLPAGALAATTVDLGDLLGTDGTLLAERAAALPGWEARFALLDEVLGRRLPAAGRVEAELGHAWRRLVAAGGGVLVGDLAAEVGWSRRHLAARFRAEYGLGPKEAARVVRFDRARRLLADPGATTAGRDGARTGPTLAQVAAVAGYADQAHLAREWRALAGAAPTAWLAADELARATSAAARTPLGMGGSRGSGLG